MKLKEIFEKKTPTISFEVFPPKADANFSEVESAVRAIAALRPSFMSVTYGAGGAGGKYTTEIAREILQDFGVPTLAHLTCVAATRATVGERIAQFREAGIENVMALRGDLPGELEGVDRSGWEYPHAIDLVRELKAAGGFCIGGACYPEIHPESTDRKEDLLRLKEKVDAGCDFLTTQMFFDNDLLYHFLYRVRDIGIEVPVVAGIMPITSAKQVDRAIRLSGSMMPRRFRALVDRFGSDGAAMTQAGIAYATDQIIDLLANGVEHIHVYTMNKPAVAAKILENLSGILKR